MDLFRRFRKETLPLQLYGKLPLAKDYLRVGASKGAGRELREWLDQSYSSNAARSGARQFPWSVRFIVPGDDGDCALGAGWSSTDHGGERPFPFVAFVERRRKLIAKALEGQTGELAPIWSEVEAFYASRSGFSDGESLLVSARGRSISPNARLARPVARVDYSSWLDALWPDQGAEGLVTLLASIARLTADGHRGPVRLPLVSDQPPLPQVAGWWSSLQGLGLWSFEHPPSAFFPQEADDGDEPRFATFVRGRLRTEDARWLESARGQANLGRGDYSRGAAVHGRSATLGENVPSLCDSMRGAVATARARR